jgi:hypothetical protein
MRTAAARTFATVRRWSAFRVFRRVLFMGFSVVPYE